MIESKKIYELNNQVDELSLRGANDTYIKAIESSLKIEIFINEHCVYLRQDDLQCEYRLINIFKAMESLILNKIELTTNDVYSIINNIDDDNVDAITKLYLKKDNLITTVSGKTKRRQQYTK